MRTQYIKCVTGLASKLAQCNTTLFMNKLIISFIKSDVDKFGTNGKPFPCPSITSLCKLCLFSLEFLYKHILLKSDCNTELSKYNILMMTMIFKGLHRQYSKGCHCKCYHNQAKYKLANNRIGNFFSGLI